MKTLCIQKPTFSDGAVHLHVPHSWEELTQEQLRYVLGMLTLDWQDDPRAWSQTLLLMRFAGFHVVRMTDKGWLCYVDGYREKTFVLTSECVASMLSSLDWVFEDGACSVRLEECQGRKAVEAELHGLPFIDYLTCENLYQAYISQSEDMSPLVDMANILYPLPKKAEEEAETQDRPEPTQMFSRAELYGVFLWYRHVKVVFSQEFPNLFRPTSEGGSQGDMKAAMNAQIRALTDGDITKEQVVMDTDVWRALTELDAKAKEAEEMKKSTK